MTKQSPHKRWKGCPLCGIHRDDSIANRSPMPVKRLLGKAKRITRHEIPDGDD